MFNAGEFIAAISRHIPDKSFQLARYFGWYSNRSRGERRKEAGQHADTQVSTPPPEEIEVLDVSKYKPRRISPRSWRESIKKVWEVDPLELPKCHAEMKIISFISKSQPEGIRKIFENLGLWAEEKIRPPPNLSQAPSKEEIITSETFDDSWPGYEESFIRVR